MSVQEKVASAIDRLYERDNLSYGPRAASGVELVGIDRDSGVVYVKNTEGTALVGYGKHYAVREEVGDKDACERVLMACAAAEAARRIDILMSRPGFERAAENKMGVIGRLNGTVFHVNADRSALVSIKGGHASSEAGHPDACAELKRELRDAGLANPLPTGGRKDDGR